jgi:hypothetical protein
MKRIGIGLGLVATMAVISACSKDSGSSGAATAASGASASAAPAASSAAPAAPAKVEVGLPTGVKLDKPKAATIGGKTVTADICKLDKRGADMKSTDFAKAIRSVQPSADGGLFVLDSDAKIRKYTVQSASPCELALDTKWGTAGILTIEDNAKKADDYLTIQVDKTGNVYASGYQKVKMVTPTGTVSTVCGDDSGTLIIDRSSGDAYFNHKHVKIDAKSCDGDAVKFSGFGDDNQPDVIDAANGQLFVKGYTKAGKDNIDKVGLYKADGTSVAVVGDKDGDGDICYAQAAQSCSLGICVVDSNCRSLRAWGLDGTLVGATDINALFGVSYSWPVDFFIGKDVAWAAFGQQGEGEKAPHFGFVARITGLN